MGSVFDIPYQELKQWGPGELVDHDKLNQPVDALNSLRRVGVNPPTQVIGTVRPPTVAPVVAAAVPFKVLRFDILRFDFMECLDDATDPPTRIEVAKPWLLRRSSFHGKTVHGITYSYSGVGSNVRHARRGSGASELVEVHLITPEYNQDDTILAVRVDGLGVLGAFGKDVLWISIDDPRMFAELIA